ncbi:MAG: hypothetical protein K8R58_00075, partial [Bacteroidales bacterium]|nr:hypothetical protein [Bacteroidales bacterium]
MKKIIILLIFITGTLFAQTKIDSLKSLLSNVSGTEKIEVLNELAVSYYKISSNKMIEYAEKSLELSQKSDYNLGEAKSLHIIGKGHSDLGNYDKSL